MPRLLLLFCVATALLGLHCPAHAGQWQALNGTSRYKVGYDEESVHLTPQGLLEIGLRFTPNGEPERKMAAAEFKEKRYRSHMEHYEIDCDKQTALLAKTDLLGVSRVRLKRLPGSAAPDPILPGSVLEHAAQRICPAPEEQTEEEENTPEESGQAEEIEPVDDSELSGDKLQQIEDLKNIIKSNGPNAETWKKLGNIYFDNDRPEQAIKAYESALALSPDDADILNDQGAMYRQTGNFEKALANFEKAYSINPANLESLYNSGYVCAFDLRDIPKALFLWRRYLEHESKSETARQVRSFIEQYDK